MCLIRILTPEEKQDFLAKIPDNKYITVYKVVALNEYRKKYMSLWTDSNYKKGVNKAKIITLDFRESKDQYPSGFHFFAKIKN